MRLFFCSKSCLRSNQSFWKSADALSNKNAQFIGNRIIQVLHSGGATCVNKYQEQEKEKQKNKISHDKPMGYLLEIVSGRCPTFFIFMNL